MLKLPFDRVVCINLPRRTDRRAAFQKHWIDAELLPSIEWFPAYDGWALKERGVIPRNNWKMQTPGFAGSWMSHQQVCRETPIGQTVLIFEDDCRPAEGIVRAWNALLRDLPNDWEGIWFGYDPNYKVMKHITDDCIRHKNPLNTHCYALRGNLLREACTMRPASEGIAHWDGALQKRAATYKVYAHHGVLVRQAVWDGEDDPKDNYEDTRCNTSL